MDGSSSGKTLMARRPGFESRSVHRVNEDAENKEKKQEKNNGKHGHYFFRLRQG